MEEHGKHVKVKRHHKNSVTSVLLLICLLIVFALIAYNEIRNQEMRSQIINNPTSLQSPSIEVTPVESQQAITSVSPSNVPHSPEKNKVPVNSNSDGKLDANSCSKAIGDFISSNKASAQIYGSQLSNNQSLYQSGSIDYSQYSANNLKFSEDKKRMDDVTLATYSNAKKMYNCP